MRAGPLASASSSVSPSTTRANQRRMRPTGVSAQGDVEARRVDRVVDLLEPQVLDDRVPARRGQSTRGTPRSPRLRSALRSGRLSPRTASATVERSVYRPAATMTHRTAGLGDVGDLDRRDDRGDPDRDRVDDHHEEAHRREQQPAGQRDEDRPGEAVDQDEDGGPASGSRGRPLRGARRSARCPARTGTAGRP